jgi:signal peptidase II
MDQFVKYKIRLNGGFYICNNGISFGLHVPTWLFFCLYIVILATFLIYYSYLLKKLPLHSLAQYGLLLFFSGATSNAIDRIVFNCVTDFIYLPFFNFPYFNIADILISLGSIIFIFTIFYKEKYPTRCIKG